MIPPTYAPEWMLLHPALQAVAVSTRQVRRHRVHAVGEGGPKWTRCHRLAAGLLLTGDPALVTCRMCRALARLYHGRARRSELEP